MQVFDEGEDVQPLQLGQHGTRVRIEVAPVGLAAFETRHRQALPGGIHAQPLQRLWHVLLQPRQQLGERQGLLAGRMALHNLRKRRIGRAHDLVFKGQRGPAQAHHRQHGAGSDAQQPVQLENNGFQHAGGSGGKAKRARRWMRMDLVIVGGRPEAVNSSRRASAASRSNRHRSHRRQCRAQASISPAANGPSFCFTMRPCASTSTEYGSRPCALPRRTLASAGPGVSSTIG